VLARRARHSRCAGRSSRADLSAQALGADRSLQSSPWLGACAGAPASPRSPWGPAFLSDYARPPRQPAGRARFSALTLGALHSYLDTLAGEGREARIHELKPGGMRPTDIARTLGIGPVERDTKTQYGLPRLMTRNY
jgi:hypothetical protein